MSAYRDQHFLSDRNAVARIAGILELSGRKVLEIGPGRGVLTRALVNAGARVIAVEIDQNLVALLNHEFGDEIREERLTLISGDANQGRDSSF